MDWDFTFDFDFGGAGYRPGGLAVPLFDDSGGGEREMRSLISCVQGEGWVADGGGGMSMTSRESMNVGGLCSRRHRATCHVPTALPAIDAPVDGAEKNVRDHMRP